jgi:hypothetical protein
LPKTGLIPVLAESNQLLTLVKSCTVIEAGEVRCGAINELALI